MTPDGYVARTLGETAYVARADLADAIADALQRHGTLYAWAAAQPQPRALRGRAPVYAASLGDARLIVRHAWHGGMLAPLTRDRWRPPTRAPRELALSTRLLALGVPTPRVLAYALYPAGPGFRRVDVAVEAVDDSADFGAVLSGDAPGIPLGEAAQAVAGLLQTMARAGVRHPDLNVKNILLAPTPSGCQPWLLDVDTAECVAPVTDAVVRTVHAANVARLVRSVHKWQSLGKVSTDAAAIDAMALRWQQAA